MQWAQSREDSSFTELLLCQYSRRGRSSSTSIPAICSTFPILKKRVMTPKIPQPQYRLAASVSIKGSQVGLARCAPADRPRLSPAVRGCHNFQRLLPLHTAVRAASRQAGFKRPRWDWNQSKNNILPKNQTKVQTLDCARSDLLLCLSDIYSVTWANSLQIHTDSQSAVRPL